MEGLAGKTLRVLPVQENTKKQIESVFSYHKPKDENVALTCQILRQKFKDMAYLVAGQVPPSRELSVALTKLEEASMATIAGVVRHQDS